ncbi:MAG: hypothetical protein QF662_04855, partial [Phycisphaerae bacterium]|nr:hypothetical protein [Phycisphaerae bacterium]
MEDTFGCEANPTGNPIGGGPGYEGVDAAGDYDVATLDQLLSALAKARKGQVVYIEQGARIEVTERVFTEDVVIEIPEGVTLAGNRGREGSQGALIFSEAFRTRPMVRAMGPGVRISGLRLRGPDPKRRMAHHRRSFGDGENRGHEYYYKFPVSDGIATEHPGLEVDNCEISAWSHAGVLLRKSRDHHIHHNHIHHCQYHGLGYGACLDAAEAVVEANLFDWCRHHISATGRPGTGYEACYNLVLEHANGHSFDMHGGRDREDGTDIAGDWMNVHHNTFRAPVVPVVIRGRPVNEAG